MSKKVAILQSNYIPWKGYFDIINLVDTFIFHDDLQYTKGDWRNRNKIKTEFGLKWLTIPCGTSEKRLISEVTLPDSSWQEKHWNTIELNYRKSRYFSVYKRFFEDIYMEKKWLNLSDMNQYIIKKISNDIFNIDTDFLDSRAYFLENKKSDRVIELLVKVNASTYLSGGAAKKYIVEDDFKKAKINLEWMDYSGYNKYDQLFSGFEHQVTILDLIFNAGPDARKYMKSFG